jgi:hypothetical protein
MHVDDRIVPGRHDSRVLAFARVPRRRNEAVRSLEDNERCPVTYALPPQRVRASNVAVKRSRSAPSVGKHKGNVVRIQPRLCRSYQRSKGVPSYETAEAFRVSFVKVFW